MTPPRPAGRFARWLLVAASFACAPPAPPALKPPPVGVVTGEVFVEDPVKRSVDGAIVELAGTSTRAITQAGLQFVLTAVPVGDNVITITHPETGRVRRVGVKVEQANQTVALGAAQTTLQLAARVTGRVTAPSGSASGAIAFLVGGSGRQAAIVGDDGTFELDGLPPGPARIGVQKTGFASAAVSLTLAEGANDAGTLALAAAATGSLTLSGKVLLADETDHSGIAVLLNGGEKVAVTDADGNYAFTGLAPGVYALTAQRGGYQSVQLPPVELTSDGQVTGGVQGLMKPGSDTSTDQANANRTFTVRTLSPETGSTVEFGTEVRLRAEVVIDGETIPGTKVKWTAEGTAPVTASRALGTGTDLVTHDFPLGEHLVTVTATAQDGTKKAASLVLNVVPVAVSVEITTLTSGMTLPAGVPVSLGARVTVRDGVTVQASDVVWSLREVGSAAPATVLGTGTRFTATLPQVPERREYELECAVSVLGGAGSGSAVVGLSLTPFRPLPSVLPLFQGYGLSVPGAVTVTDDRGNLVRVEYAVTQGQPVVLRAVLDEAADFHGTVRWQSDTGILFTGTDADLSLLPVGTHDFALTLESEDGVSASTTVRVAVSAFVFTATVAAPVLSPPSPYYVDFGLPLEGSATHPYQSSFSPTAVRWRALDGHVVSNGFRSTARGLASGPGTLTLEVVDALGQVATAQASYVLQAIEFTTGFLSPADGTDVLQGTSIEFRAQAAHSLVPSQIPSSQLKFRYASSVSGLLADAAGKSQFAVGESLVTSALVPGTHVITVTASVGQQQVSASRTIRVRSPAVTATLQSPVGDLTVFPGTAVKFQAAVSSDAAVTPWVSWLLDGAEFGASWGGYGTDPAAAARRTIDLGTYAATTAPFTDTRWGPGTHRVQMFARASDVDPALGCVDIPNRAVCRTIVVVVSPANPDITTATIGAGQTVVWDGLRRLKGIVTVDGGTLVVNPGARIVVDITGSSYDRRILLNAGTLRIGSAQATDPVVFEGTIAANDKWRGIQLTSNSASGPALLVVENAVFRHTAHAIDNESSYWDADDKRVELRNVTVERAAGAWRDFCPQVADGVVSRNTTESAVIEGGGANCGPSRTYRRLRFENCPQSFDVRTYDGADWTFAENVHIGSPLYSSAPRTGTVTVRDSVFEACSRSNLSALSQAGDSAPGAAITLLRNVFRNNQTTSAVWLSGYRYSAMAPGTVEREVSGNLFENNTVALRDRTADRRRVLIHGNTFSGNGTDVDAQRENGYVTDAPDVEAQGNWLGAAGDVTTAGGFMQAATTPGISNAPRIYDTFDASTAARVVRIDNPLQAAATAPGLDAIVAGRAWPVTPLVTNVALGIIREPQQSHAYRPDRCVPLVALSPLEDVDVSSACTWKLAPSDGAAASFATVGRTAAGCVDPSTISLRDGEWKVRLECTDPVSGRVDVHETRIRLATAGARAGRQAEPVEEWSGEVLVDGDYLVPAGYTLRIAAGTRVRFAQNDRLRGASTPFMNNLNPNYAYGSRALVDLVVEGTLEVNGTQAAPVRFESVTGAELPGQWGSILVDRGARAIVTGARFAGATYGLHGLVTTSDLSDMPVIELRSSEFHGVTAVLRGACAQVFDGVVAERAEQAHSEGRCHQAMSITNSTFTRMTNSGSNALFYVRPTQDIGPAALSFTASGLVLAREGGNRDGVAFDVGSRNDQTSSFGLIRLVNVRADYFGTFFEWDGTNVRTEVMQVDGLRLSHFERLLGGVSYTEEDELSMTNSILQDATFLLRDALGRFLLSNSIVRDVKTVVGYFSGTTYYTDDVASGRFTTLSLTGNRFERVGRVISARHSGGTNVQWTATLTGNEFLSPQEKVVFVDPYALNTGNTISIDARGNWWGTATDSAIRGLMTDPQTSLGALYVGRTRYEGAATAPLTTLTLPTEP